MPTQTEAQQKAAKGCLGCVGLVVLLVVAVVVISHLSYTPEDEAVFDVKVSMTAPAAKSKIAGFKYETALYRGGVAVLVQGMAAYWVKDDVVYVANGHAMAWSPNARKAPVGIGFSEIKGAVESR